ncbi:hypothetical protein GJ496_011735 [Pomphorhynchus laevis]|nr:hypothetical protein GJ496_011735 [Pomphorhynchus laevis]
MSLCRYHLNIMIDNHIKLTLTQAVQKDTDGLRSEAIKLYREGAEGLKASLKDADKSEWIKHHAIIEHKIEQYLKRAEKLEQIVSVNFGDSIRNSSNSLHQELRISDNATGYSYEHVFGVCLNTITTKLIEIYDPYIRSRHQLQNLVRFLEFVVSRQCSVSEILLFTTRENPKDLQENTLQSLKKQLATSYRIKFEYTFKETLHDREVKFIPGGVVRLGRGLDYFKNCDDKWGLTIGCYNLNMRPCKETVIDIFKDR